MVPRPSDPSMSALLPDGLEVLTCTKRQPQAASRTMHVPEWPMDYTTTSKSGMTFPSATDSHRSTNLPEVKRMKDTAQTKMICDVNFYETARGRKSVKIGSDAPNLSELGPEGWQTTTGDMQRHALEPNHESKADDTLARLTQKPQLKSVRGGFENSTTNRLAVFPRIGGHVPTGPEGVQPRPLLTQDFRRKLGPQMGHETLGPKFTKDRVMRKTAFLSHSEAYLRPGKQIWSG